LKALGLIFDAGFENNYENLYGSWKKVIIWFHPDIWQNTYIV